MPPKILLVTVGSLGDLHPFIALGLALQLRGAAVTLVSAAEYRTKVERAGLLFAGVRPSFEDLQRDLRMTRAELTRKILGRNDFLLRRLIAPYVRDAYEDLTPLVGDADLVVTSSLAFGARLAAERAMVPWVGVVLQPLMFLSAFDPPVIPKLAALTVLLRRLGPGATHAVLNAVKWALARQLEPVQALRAAIGLPNTRRNPMFEGQFGPAGAIALYSPLLGGMQPDYPRPTAITGFARFDSGDGASAALDAGLQQFLAAGERPLVFTLGSLIVNCPGTFYRDSLAAARILGKRSVLLVGEDGLEGVAGIAADAGQGGGDVHITRYAPHSLLFPRAAAIVHHGGIGTLAQALSSGRPQLVVPYYADQIDNAARAVGLGVARSLAPNRYTGRAAARHLAALLSAAAYATSAASVRERLAGEGGADTAAAVILNRLDSLVFGRPHPSVNS